MAKHRKTNITMKKGDIIKLLEEEEVVVNDMGLMGIDETMYEYIADKIIEMRSGVLADVVLQSEQLLAFGWYMMEHSNVNDGKTAKDYLQEFLSQ